MALVVDGGAAAFGACRVGDGKAAVTGGLSVYLVSEVANRCAFNRSTQCRLLGPCPCACTEMPEKSNCPRESGIVYVSNVGLNDSADREVKRCSGCSSGRESSRCHALMDMIYG